MLNGESQFELIKFFLIGTIVWYRDNYRNTTDEYHNELIERVKNANTVEELDAVDRLLDDWLDY